MADAASGSSSWWHHLHSARRPAVATVALSNWRATMLKVKDLAGHPLLARFLSLPSKTEPLRKFIECVRFTKSFVTCDQKNWASMVRPQNTSIKCDKMWFEKFILYFEAQTPTTKIGVISSPHQTVPYDTWHENWVTCQFWVEAV